MEGNLAYVLLLFEMDPADVLTHEGNDICSNFFIALFVTANDWGRTYCLLIGNGLNNLN